MTTVQDYGRGFHMGIERRARTRGCGLVIMRERALAVGGRLWIESEPGAGTRVIVEVPAEVPVSDAPALAFPDSSSAAHADPRPSGR